MKNLLAQIDYAPLAPIPQLLKQGSTATSSTQSFLQGIVPLIIGVAAGLAVIMIVVGGIKYMTTDAFMGKKEAKDTIRNAFMGLLLAISSYVLLNTINPKLVNIDLEIKNLPLAGRIASSTEITELSAYDLKCNNECVPFDTSSVPIKPIGACLNDPCYVNRALLEKLKTLDAELKSKGVTWQVTEAFPPTVPHIDNCHKPDNNQTGKCVDAALFHPTTENIVIFLTAIEKVFGPNASYLYERCINGRNPLTNVPELQPFRSHLDCKSTTNAQHAHINLSR